MSQMHTTRVKTMVTAELIAAGQPHMAYRCPVALALQPVLASHLSCAVGKGEFHILDERQTGEEYSAEFPIGVTAWIAEFDRAGPAAVEPFELELDLPARFLRAEA